MFTDMQVLFSFSFQLPFSFSRLKVLNDGVETPNLPLKIWEFGLRIADVVETYACSYRRRQHATQRNTGKIVSGSP